MGYFRVRFGISSLGVGAEAIELEGLVDTGAAYPFIPENVLRSLDVKPIREETFTLADGSQMRLAVGEARFYYQSKSAPCLVVFAPKGTEPLFGVLALESLGLEVDPVNQRLKPATLFLAPCAP